GTAVIRHTGPGLVDPPAPGRSVRTRAADEVGRDHVDRRIARLRRARALDLRLVIAGRERLAVADPDPVEPVAEEGCGPLRGDRRRLGAKRRPVLSLRERRLVLATDQHRTAGAESLQRPL